MAYVLGGKKLQVGVAFVHPDGRQFSRNFFHHASEKTKADLGIEWVPEPKKQEPVFDKRFWWAPRRPRNLQKLKEKWTDKYSIQALRLLSSSDWRVVKARELGKDVPREWFDYRQKVRAVCNARQKDLQNAEDMFEFQYIINNPGHQWPISPDEIKNATKKNP